MPELAWQVAAAHVLSFGQAVQVALLERYVYAGHVVHVLGCESTSAAPNSTRWLQNWQLESAAVEQVA
jgi:hypothetical protein